MLTRKTIARKLNLKKRSKSLKKSLAKNKKMIKPFIQKSKSIVYDTASTFHELLFLLAFMTVVGGGTYALFESTSILSGLKWAFLTAFTINYGDMKPNSLSAQVVGTILMTVSVFVIVPLITAILVKRTIKSETPTRKTRKKKSQK